MGATRDILQSKWPELKGQVRQQFGKLTAEDVERVRGRPAKLVLLLRERYLVAFLFHAWLAVPD